MADTSFAVTAGSGTPLHTVTTSIGGTTVHDQVIKQGEPYLATYSVSVTNISTATGASHILQIMAGTTLRVRLRRLYVYQYSLATTAAIIDFGLYRLTTAGTGGTAVTPQLYDPADAAAGATAMTLPTAKGTEGALLYRAASYMIQTAAASAGPLQPVLALDFDALRITPPIIAAGTSNGIAFKNVNAVAAGALQVTAIISESNF